MSDQKKRTTSSISLIGAAGTLTGFFGNTALTGIDGFLKAMMIGGATSLGAGVCGFVGIQVGTLIGSLVTGGKEVGKTAGYIIGAASGLVFGGVQGYEFGEKAIIDPCNQTTSLNIQSQDSFNAVAEKNTLVLTARDFTPALKPKALAPAA